MIRRYEVVNESCIGPLNFARSAGCIAAASTVFGCLGALLTALTRWDSRRSFAKKSRNHYCQLYQLFFFRLVMKQENVGGDCYI